MYKISIFWGFIYPGETFEFSDSLVAQSQGLYIKLGLRKVALKISLDRFFYLISLLSNGGLGKNDVHKHTL